MLSFLESIFGLRPKTSPKTGDYLLARAKRQKERMLREDGYSRSQAVKIVSEQNGDISRKSPDSMGGPFGNDGSQGSVGYRANTSDGMSAGLLRTRNSNQELPK